jgi:subtilase family serine protease
MHFSVKALALLALAAPLVCGEARQHRSPLVAIGPRAIPVLTTGTSDTFSCQAPGANPVCYSPSQIRTAYNIQPLLDEGFTGRGKTIVIIDAFQSPTIVADLNVFINAFSLSAMNGLGGASKNSLPTFTQIAPDGLTPFDPNNQDMLSWSGEISLDVEWAHAIAPGANIVLVLAKSDADADILSATKYAIDHRLGDVISQSFGEDESCKASSIATQEHQLYIEATLKSITLFASSGDDGAALPSCDGSTFVKGVSSPAVDPLVVGVGGTALIAASVCDTCGTPGTYQGETAWNDSFGSSSGGYSALVNKPFFQIAAVKGTKRGVPDVAYNGAVSTGVLTAWSGGVPANVGSLYLFGGTSAGSPQWAALITLADQRAGYDLGFINQGLYLLGLNRGLYSASFHDITVGNNTFDGITGYNAGPGWDPTTGLGSPKGIYFVDNLLKTVSPLDGLIGIIESGPSGNNLPHAPGHSKPH